MKGNSMNNYVNTQIEAKKSELDKKREAFDIMVQTELYSDNPHFEPNLIAILTSMAMMKSEHATLENLKPVN